MLVNQKLQTLGPLLHFVNNEKKKNNRLISKLVHIIFSQHTLEC